MNNSTAVSISSLVMIRVILMRPLETFGNTWTAITFPMNPRLRQWTKRKISGGLGTSYAIQLWHLQATHSPELVFVVRDQGQSTCKSMGSDPKIVVHPAFSFQVCTNLSVCLGSSIR